MQLSLRIKYLRHANDIKEIPREIAQLACLKYLILSDNCIQCIPDEMEKCTALESLYLNKNDIRIIPESLKTLTHLHLFFVNGNPLNPDVSLNGYPTLLPICKNIVR
jgi:Leucine-rich repeat (LRR) protein